MLSGYGEGGVGARCIGVNPSRQSVASAVFAVAVAWLQTPFLGAAESPSEEEKLEESQRMLQIQLFLDDSGFRPGVIDGKWGEFTRKAVGRYLRAEGKEAPALDDKAPPADLDLPLDPERPTLMVYQISAADEDAVGELPDGPAAQAKQKRLPYVSVVEAVAEKFHAKVELLKELNPDARWKRGESVCVPNVKRPFDFAAVTELKKQAAKQQKNKSRESDPPTLSVVIDTAEKVLDLMEGDRLVGSMPITPGSDRLSAPTGEWKIKRVVWLPPFRWDKEMLLRGKRSGNAHHLPPGPNSPVGIIWMALDKDGIGLHGTAEPETIGRSASHGCIRLANWDAFELGQKLGAGVKVVIRGGE